MFFFLLSLLLLLLEFIFSNSFMINIWNPQRTLADYAVIASAQQSLCWISAPCCSDRTAEALLTGIQHYEINLQHVPFLFFCLTSSMFNIEHVLHLLYQRLHQKKPKTDYVGVNKME